MRTAILILPALLLAQRPVPTDNEWARVVVATSVPGPKGRLHKHDTNRVMVYLDKGAQRLEFENGSKTEVTFGAGEVKWDTSGGMHTSQNTGGTTFRVVEVELRKSGGPVTWPALDPLKVAPGVYKVEIDNEQVRVLRARLGPGQSVALHEHALPRVVIPLTDVEVQVTGVDGKTSLLKAKAGEAIFGPGVRHREVNLRDAVAELILVEFKG
jgi:uncharacterized RmlC-like cupin family protein